MCLLPAPSAALPKSKVQLIWAPYAPAQMILIPPSRLCGGKEGGREEEREGKREKGLGLHVLAVVCHRGPKWALYSLELELQMVVSYPVWVLETEL